MGRQEEDKTEQRMNRMNGQTWGIVERIPVAAECMGKEVKRKKRIAVDKDTEQELRSRHTEIAGCKENRKMKRGDC